MKKSQYKSTIIHVPWGTIAEQFTPGWPFIFIYTVIICHYWLTVVPQQASKALHHHCKDTWIWQSRTTQSYSSYDNNWVTKESISRDALCSILCIVFNLLDTDMTDSKMTAKGKQPRVSVMSLNLVSDYSFLVECDKLVFTHEPTIWVPASKRIQCHSQV